MRNYANGLETKAGIIEICKQLFLEKGYKNTTYSEIYKAAMVNPGTIAHHFGNKRNIATLLYDGLMTRYVELAKELFPEEDNQQHILISFGIHRKMIYENAAVRRFSYEYMLDDLSNDSMDRYVDPDFLSFQMTKEQLGFERTEFFFVAYKGIEAAIDTFFDRHPGKLSFEEFFTYYAQMYFFYLGESELEERTDRALIQLSKLNIDFNNFDVLASFKEESEFE